MAGSSRWGESYISMYLLSCCLITESPLRICDPVRLISLLVNIPMGREAMLTAEPFTFCWLSWIVIYPPLIAHSFPSNPIFFVNYPSHKSYSMGTLGPHFFPSFCKASVQLFCRGCGCLLCRVWGG